MSCCRRKPSRLRCAPGTRRICTKRSRICARNTKEPTHFVLPCRCSAPDSVLALNETRKRLTITETVDLQPNPLPRQPLVSPGLIGSAAGSPFHCELFAIDKSIYHYR